MAFAVAAQLCAGLYHDPSVVWDRFDLHDILAFYGTAGGKWRMRVQPQAAYLPGEDWSAYGTQ